MGEDAPVDAPAPAVMSGLPVVMVIRHAEKPTAAHHDVPEQFGVDKHGQPSSRGLTPRGWSRAGALAVRFDQAGGEQGAWVRPHGIHAAPATHDNHSHRCLDTAGPIADRLAIPVHHHHARGDEAALADEVIRSGRHTLIVWDHGHLPDLLRAFEPVNPHDIFDPWPADRFDLVAVLVPQSGDGSAGARNYRVQILGQDVLAGDAPNSPDATKPRMGDTAR